MIQIHGIVIDQTRWEVLVDGKPVTLSKSEFLLLRFLAIHPGVDHSRQQIIDGTGGPDYPVTARSVDVQVTGLRKKLGDLGQLIDGSWFWLSFPEEGPNGSTTDDPLAPR